MKLGQEALQNVSLGVIIQLCLLCCWSPHTSSASKSTPWSNFSRQVTTHLVNITSQIHALNKSLVFYAFCWNRGFWVLSVSHLKCFFLFVCLFSFRNVKVENVHRPGALLGGIVRKATAWWIKGRSNELCYVSSCTTFIYLVFVTIFHDIFFYNGISVNQAKSGFCPLLNLSICFIFNCCHMVLILATQYFHAMYLLRQKIQYGIVQEHSVFTASGEQNICMSCSFVHFSNVHFILTFRKHECLWNECLICWSVWSETFKACLLASAWHFVH